MKIRSLVVALLWGLMVSSRVPALERPDLEFKIFQFPRNMERRLVAFKDLSRGKITSCLWDFGDSTTSTEQNPIHQYKKTGEFVVILTVKGPDGKARRIKVRDVAVW